MASEEQLVFSMELDSGSVTQGATDSADALEKLKDAIQGDTVALREMQAALRNMKGSALASDDTIKTLKDRIAGSKATIASNTLEMLKNKDAFAKKAKAPEGGKAPAEPIDHIAEAIKRLNKTQQRSADILRLQMAPALEKNKRNIDQYGPKIGGLINKFGDLRGMLSNGAMLAGFVAVAAGIVAVAAAAVAATASLVGYAIAQADARRSDLLRLEGLSKVRNYWQEMVTGQRRAADSASFLQKTIDGVASGSSLTRDRIGEMTSELYRAGLRGQRLKDGLEGLAIVEATQGKESAAQFKARAMGAYIYGTSIKALTNDVKNRLGPTAKAMMLSLDVQGTKARENIAHLFDGLKIEKFLEGLSKITEMFSQNTASGRALKKLVETLLQPLIDMTAKTGPIVKKFFQGVVIGALLMAIGIYKVRNALRDTFGGSKFFGDMNLMNLALNLGVIAFGALAGAAAGVLGIILVLTAAAAAIAAPFIVAGIAVAGFINMLSKLADEVKSFNWKEAGSQVADGVTDGLTLGAPRAIKAMREMGGNMMAAYRKALDMHSPSRLVRKITLGVPQGAAQGIDDGAPLVRKSAAGMGAAAEQGMRAGMGGVTARTNAGGASQASAPIMSSRPTVNLTVEHLTIGPGQSPEQIKASLREAVEELFERTAHTMGAQL